MIQFDIFQMGWNHQPDMFCFSYPSLVETCDNVAQQLDVCHP